MWNLSSRTRNQTHVLCIARCILNHWTTREFAHQDILWSVPCLDHFWQSFMPLLNSMPPKSLEGPRQGLYILVLGKVLPCTLLHPMHHHAQRTHVIHTDDNVCGQTHTWAEDLDLCVSPVPAPSETGSAYLSIPPKFYLPGGPYAFIPYVFIQPLRVLH